MTALEIVAYSDDDDGLARTTRSLDDDGDVRAQLSARREIALAAARVPKMGSRSRESRIAVVMV